MFINLVGNGGGATAGVTSLNGQKGDLKLKTVNNNDLLGEGNIKIQAGVTSVNGQKGAVVIDVPTKVSQLQNDATYQTKEQVTVSINEAMSGATGGMEYVSLSQMTTEEALAFRQYFWENLDENKVYHGNKWPFIGNLDSKYFLPATIVEFPNSASTLTAWYLSKEGNWRQQNLKANGTYQGTYTANFEASTDYYCVTLLENIYGYDPKLNLDETDTDVELYGKRLLSDATVDPLSGTYRNVSVLLKRDGTYFWCLAYINYNYTTEKGQLKFIYKDECYTYDIIDKIVGNIHVKFVSKEPCGNINSSEVSNIKVLTQAEYDAIDPKDEKTLYMIKG